MARRAKIKDAQGRVVEIEHDTGTTENLIEQALAAYDKLRDQEKAKDKRTGAGT